MKKLFFLLFTLTSLISYSQSEEIDSLKIEDKSKLISLGAKIGIPNLASLNGEIILPILDNHFAPYIDYGAFNLDIDDTESDLNYAEYGINFYFSNKGKGLYAGAGIAQLDSEFTFNNLTFEENGVSQIGSAKTNLDINTLNLKLGFRTGGSIYFRLEIGYGMGSIPDSIDFVATSNGITESFSEEVPAIPGLSSGGLLISNFGFGLSF
jgi:hypothetical protein